MVIVQIYAYIVISEVYEELVVVFINGSNDFKWKQNYSYDDQIHFLK